jgi:adenylate cyclase
MPRNVEIKARVDGFRALLSGLEEIADSGPTELDQEDTFFGCVKGRLKLRVLSPTAGELIFYQRANLAGPRESRYSLSRTNEPARLMGVLEAACGVLGEVKKRRTLFLVGQTRVHLDEVEGLGQFVELEVQLTEDQSEAEGVAVAKMLIQTLAIPESDLVEGAYFDMLQGLDATDWGEDSG